MHQLFSIAHCVRRKVELTGIDVIKKTFTEEELIDLYYERAGRCIVTGRRAPFKYASQKRVLYWRFTIDHFVPLSRSKNYDWAWAKNNL